MKKSILSLLRKYLLAGLFIWLPIWVTFLVLEFLTNLMDGSLKLLPKSIQPDFLLGFHLPGLGIVFTLVILFFTGMLAANLLGQHLLDLWNRLIARIPLVRTIYNAVQQVVDTILSPQGKAFRKVLLVEFPRKNMWTIAFQTGNGCREANNKLQKEMVTVFVPNTPVPSAGFLMMVAKDEVFELNMTVDQAIKFVISLGVILPEDVLTPKQLETLKAKEQIK